VSLDEFRLEDALQMAASGLSADHSFVMARAGMSETAISYTLSRRMPVVRTFLGGSTARQTWGAPRFEFDMFVILGDEYRNYLGSSPAAIMEDIANTLRHTRSFVRQKGSGRVAAMEGDWQGYGPARPASIIVLPAFVADRGLLIPDQWRDEWIGIDPEYLDALGRAADRRLANWRELTRIVKAWNNRDAKFEPFIKPGLLIEVMTMAIGRDAAAPDLGTQLAALFQMMLRRFDEDWPDPAGLGPPLSSYMTSHRRSFAKQHLERTWRTLAEAKRADSRGDLHEARRLARSVLGRMVPIAARDEDGDLIVANPFRKRR
jgi:hypothetical protein